MRTFPPGQLEGLTSMNLHQLITLMVPLIGTSGTNEIQHIKYTSEYILKWQIHQHSLLTMKVFFRHNFQHKYSSLYHLDHHQVLVIFKSSSSSSHIYLQVIFIWIWIITRLDHHHWIWIITRSGSSLDIITRSGSSLLDHHHWIITGAISRFFLS